MTALDPQLVLDRFVVGPGNRLAAAAARRTAESPGRSYNPLVICGAAGLGKTHLLVAVGHRARSLDPELRVHYETADALIDRVTTSISAGTLEEFRAANAETGLLLLDDLQQLSGRARTQEELLRLWDELEQRGAQVVVSADRAPAEIPDLDERLVARLATGLTVELAAPDRETRTAILQQMVAERGLVLNDEVMDALAELPIASVRDLERALDRVLGGGAVEEPPVDAAGVASLLGLESGAQDEAADEFGAFVSDISTAVAAVVETAPWRRRLAEAILRWEGEGVRTRRLEEALDADSAPDVEALLSAFSRDVSRLRQIARELPQAAVPDPLLVRDPDRLEEAEALLAEVRRTRSTGASPSAPEPAAASSPAPAAQGSVDRWFLDREKLAWRWLSLDERMVEEQR